MFGISKKMVMKGKEFRRILPANFKKADEKHFSINSKYHSPDIHLYFFKSVYLLPDSSLFIWKFWPLSLSFPFFRKRIIHHSIKGLTDIVRSWHFRKYDLEKNPYLVIHDQWTMNFYHWMTQALPRLLLMLREKKEFILLLPENYTSEFHVKSLQMLGVCTWEKLSSVKTFYEVHNLVYPSHDVQIGDYHDDLIVELVTVLKSKVTHVPGKKRLFVQRNTKGVREILNENEVIACFLSWGFEIVTFENMSFEDQLKMAGNASIISGVHGAGLTNMMFMNSGSKVFELTSSLKGEQYYYFTLSNALSHHYYYQFCEPDGQAKTIQEANFFVDIDLLNKNLELMTMN